MLNTCLVHSTNVTGGQMPLFQDLCVHLFYATSSFPTGTFAIFSPSWHYGAGMAEIKAVCARLTHWGTELRGGHTAAELEEDSRELQWNSRWILDPGWSHKIIPSQRYSQGGHKDTAYRPKGPLSSWAGNREAQAVLIMLRTIIVWQLAHMASVWISNQNLNAYHWVIIYIWFPNCDLHLNLSLKK